MQKLNEQRLKSRLEHLARAVGPSGGQGSGAGGAEGRRPWELL